jgi:hypothetical protein
MDHNVRFPDWDEFKNRIKIHVRKHKTKYTFGAGIIVGAIVFVVFRGRTMSSFNFGDTNTAILSRQNIVTIRQEVGRPPHLVYDLTANRFYGSQTNAAKLLGTTDAVVSRHLNGYRPNANGHKLEWLILDSSGN